VAHRRARLTVFGRQLLVARVAAGWPAAHVAEQLGISRATAYKWVRRHRAEGDPGLSDQSSRPPRSPRRLADAVETEILAARATWRYGPDRLGPLLGRPPSTVHRVLQRRGFSRLRDADRVTTAPIQYVACHPGALVHQDHKKLGRIPDGGGWRALGRAAAPDRNRSNAGPRASRGGHRRRQPLHRRGPGARRERVLTDNGWAYTHSTAYRAVARDLRVRHKRTRPFGPQTNGKAERVIQTLLHEWAYGRPYRTRPYRTNEERSAALPGFVDFFNRARPHTALGGRSPLDAVNNVLGDHT